MLFAFKARNVAKERHQKFFANYCKKLVKASGVVSKTIDFCQPGVLLGLMARETAKLYWF